VDQEIKNLKSLKKNKHEVHRDIGKEELFNYILNWLNSRTN